MIPADAIREAGSQEKPFERIRDIQHVDYDNIRSDGNAMHTFEAALWCLTHADNYRDCMTTTVEMGDNTDTTTAVAGTFAGSYHGYDAIPHEWIGQLHGKDVIDGCIGEEGAGQN